MNNFRYLHKELVNLGLGYEWALDQGWQSGLKLGNCFVPETKAFVDWPYAARHKALKS